MLVLATAGQTERFGDLLHMLLSFERRNPTWNEIKAVRRLFFPRMRT